MSIRILLRTLVIALAAFSESNVGAQYPANRQEIKPCPDSPRSPFRYAIARNAIIEISHYPNGPTVKSRGVDVLLDEKSFTEGI